MMVYMTLIFRITSTFTFALLQHSNVRCTTSITISFSVIYFRVHGRHSTDTKRISFCHSYTSRLSVCITYIFSFPLFYLLTVGVAGYCCAQSRSMTHSSVGLLRTRIVPHAQTSTWKQQTTLTTDRTPRPRRVSNPQSSKREAADPRHTLDGAAIGIGYVRSRV